MATVPRPRAPWWLYLVAASFLGLFALSKYVQYWGPQPAGIEPIFSDRGMVLQGVTPGQAAARAGLRAGDRIVAVEGQAIRDLMDWAAVRTNFEVGRPRMMEIERDGQRLQLTLLPQQRHWADQALDDRINDVVSTAGRLTMLCLGLFIAFRRPRDLVALVGASLLLAVAALVGLPPYGFAAIWRQLPLPLGALLWVARLGSFLLAPLLFTFSALFPRKLFRTPWAWVLVWTLWLLVMIWFLPYEFRILYRPDHATGGVPGWLVPFLAYFYAPAYILGGLLALVVNYRRLEDANERRRVRVLVTGSVAGWLGFFTQVIFIAQQTPTTGIAAFLQSAPALVVEIILFYLVFPLSFAYAILRHRLFDIGVMIRQGLQYALARRLVLSLVPALAAILLLDLLLHGERPLFEIVQARGWIYLTLGGLALTAHIQRHTWMAALDRRFFRERYDAQRLLREVVEEIRVAGSLGSVAPRVVAQIEVALHPEFAALLVREPRGTHFSTLASSPLGQAPPALPAESKLVALVRLLNKPLEISPSDASWLRQQLPHEETDFLRRARIDFLVPVASAPDRAEALLVLGPKRSEEPYSRDDQEVLVAIAAGLALLLDKPAPVTAPPCPSETFQECPQCGSCYDSRTSQCERDSSVLAPVRLPRLLAERYRLERRIGRGGMGTVYEAGDVALQRRVAVKVIRDDLVGSPEAAERFRREARAAAGFTHPNVVTVHDFGVAAGTRAFLVMELLKGVSLREELRRQTRLPASRAVAILRGVCAAVDAAHRRNLIHRDLKPENIFLARDGSAEQVKVLDFGVAKFLPTDTQATRDADTGAGALVGTMQYMGPEQLRGEPVDVSWDLWALAFVAYEILAGEKPFSGRTAAQWHAAVIGGKLILISAHLPEAPPRWQDFFSRVLAPDRHQRPASASALLSDLERALT